MCLASDHCPEPWTGQRSPRELHCGLLRATRHWLIASLSAVGNQRPPSSLSGGLRRLYIFSSLLWLRVSGAIELVHFLSSCGMLSRESSKRIDPKLYWGLWAQRGFMRSHSQPLQCFHTTALPIIVSQSLCHEVPGPGSPLLWLPLPFPLPFFSFLFFFLSASPLLSHSSILFSKSY